MSDTTNLYLDLMKQTLTFLVYGQEQFTRMERPASFLKSMIYDALCRRNVIPMRPLPIDREARMNGRDWPPIAYTMIGKKRLENLQQCAVDVFQKNVPGDFIEAGAWRGAAIFLRAVLKAHGIDDRVLYVADSFEGLPQADTNRFPAERGYDYSDPFLAVSLDQVKLNFSRFDLLDDQVQFVKGWFKDTLPNLKDHRWSLMWLDGDYL